jgi:hypothetical protein
MQRYAEEIKAKLEVKRANPKYEEKSREDLKPTDQEQGLKAKGSRPFLLTMIYIRSML